MSLFQCENCGAIENTALASQGIGKHDFFIELFDWTGIEDRKGKLLCSECCPTKYSDGRPTEFGKWHGKFTRKIEALGKYKTGRDGNLVEVEKR